jgi:hypothetical protein
LIYLKVAPNANVRHGLFAQGSLQVGKVTTLALPVNAVRTDKPQPYVQIVNQGQVQHVNVTLGARGEANGIAVVAVTGVPVNSVVLHGGVGSLRAGTPVQVAAVGGH